MSFGGGFNFRLVWGWETYIALSIFYVKFRILNIFSKLLYARVFLKNHAKSIGFQVVIKSQHLSRLSNHNVPSGSSANPYGERRRREFDGTGGTDGDQKCHLNFFIIYGCINNIIYIIRNKNFHQNSYGFQNLMSSWG